jgi:hypothetical protein
MTEEACGAGYLHGDMPTRANSKLQLLPAAQLSASLLWFQTRHTFLATGPIA